MKYPASKPFEPALIEMLREDELFAIEYLRAAMEERDEPRVLLAALRQIAQARGGLATIARKAGIERESLYRVLSAKGNPTLSTLDAVVRALGLRLTVDKPPGTESQPARRRAKRRSGIAVASA